MNSFLLRDVNLHDILLDLVGMRLLVQWLVNDLALATHHPVVFPQYELLDAEVLELGVIYDIPFKLFL